MRRSDCNLSFLEAKGTNELHDLKVDKKTVYKTLKQFFVMSITSRAATY